MSSEHDRLLAQGPRTAPEPRMAADDGSVVAAPAIVPDASEQAKPLRLPSGSTRRRSPAGFGRFIVPLLVFAGIAARAGGGPVEIGAFIALAIAAVTIYFVRKGREL